MIRKMRKEIMRLTHGKPPVARVLNRDDDGKLYPKKEWGCCLEVAVNGYRICAPDDNWYEAYKACLDCARLAATWEPFKPIENNETTVRI